MSQSGFHGISTFGKAHSFCWKPGLTIKISWCLTIATRDSCRKTWGNILLRVGFRHFFQSKIPGQATFQLIFQYTPSHPYNSHTIPIRIPWSMGSSWVYMGFGSHVPWGKPRDWPCIAFFSWCKLQLGLSFISEFVKLGLIWKQMIQ